VNTFALISAQGGSKGIPRKNLELIAGKPLIVWTIGAALRSSLLAAVVVSTDDPEIAAVNDRRNGTAQIQQRMHLHRRLDLPKRRRIEQAQAQVDGGGIERVDGRIEIDVQRFLGVEFSGARNHLHRQHLIDAPVAQVQCIRQRGARRHVLHSRVKQLRAIGSEADFDVAQGLAPRQLRKGHHAKQIGAAQGAYTRITAMTLDDSPKGLPLNKLHDLRKQSLAHVHASPQVV
jgi:hypothetical protein